MTIPYFTLLRKSYIIEIKHWGQAEVKNLTDTITSEAVKLNDKAKRLKGRLKRYCPVDLGFISGKFLFTRGEKETYKDGFYRKRINGIDVFGLSEWKDLLEVGLQVRLTSQQINEICQALNPPRHAANDEGLAQFQQFVDLKLVSPQEEKFRRVFQGCHRDTRDKVLLHIYDLSIEDKNKSLEMVAKRECDVLQKLQKLPCLPMLRDTFQEAKAYPGELFFFTYLDSEAPTLAERNQDSNWTIDERIGAFRQCVQALHDIHSFSDQSPIDTVLHRNVTPQTIRIRSDNRPLLTQLHCAKLPGTMTVAGLVSPDREALEKYAAPEVRQLGLPACTTASEVFALCASFRETFSGSESPLAKAVIEVLQSGLEENPAQRCTLGQLQEALESIGTTAQQIEVKAKVLPVQYWDEETVMKFHDRYYRIVSRLGSGSVGTTFKVVEVDPHTKGHLSGPYVAKAITNHQVGKAATEAYARVRAQTNKPYLAGVFEVATEWHPGEINALLAWVEGESLHEWVGTLPLYFDELGGEGRDSVAIRWIRMLCEGLTSLHQAGLVHGDVSPRNIIVGGDNVTLTDFDLSGPAGSVPLHGTFHYCSPNVDARTRITASDDVFALAATFFHVLFDRLPFDRAGGPDKNRGLNWDEIDLREWVLVKEFLDLATHPDQTQRFQTAMEAVEFIKKSGEISFAPESVPTGPSEALPFTPNEVPWLKLLLQSYPGSPKGNAETRGLDSDFARQTYVETGLDLQLLNDIRDRRVSLVILCGNAGDGKTAFLQHLAKSLKPDEVHTSDQRLWDFHLPDGLHIRANLDGSAAFKNRSAKELLNEIFAPFETPQFPPDLVHLVAINDGPLLDWLEEKPHSHLAEQLYSALQQDEETELDPRIRFIDLNSRSLVGGINSPPLGVSSSFLDQLLNKLLGEEKTWEPCLTCSANHRCQAFQSIQALQHPRQITRARLAQVLRAVHQRGELHITARNLRAALVYMFFGTNDCQDLHADLDLNPEHFWDRAFNASSNQRQGDLLNEIQKLDPALESHPRIDRYLLQNNPSNSKLASLRRRAYFQWDEATIREHGGTELALGLAQGRHFDAFLKIGAGNAEEQVTICNDLCEGIARIEDLPEQAFSSGFVPIKISPRTPTETVFWVNKPRAQFSVRPILPRAVSGIETLHTRVELVYESEAGHEEVLNIGAELFGLLMELKDGYQLSDIRSDDVFANLSIFKQRLAQEDERQLFAWNPLEDSIFNLQAVVTDRIQKLVISRIEGGPK